MTSCRAALIALAAAATACAGEIAFPAPSPASVEPALGYASMSIPVTIRGEGFHLRATQGVDGRGEASASAAFRAWLDDVELEDVAWVDASTLTATVPASLPAGPHALTVEGAYATRGTAPAAYGVLPGPGTRLVAEAAPVQPSVTAGQPARIDVTLTNEGPGRLRDARGLLRHVVGDVAAQPVAGDPGRFDLAPGESAVVRYEVATSVSGPLTFEAKAAGVEVATGAGVASGEVRTTVAVQTAPELVAVATLSAPAVPLGGTVTATLEVTNRGDAAARVTPVAVAGGTAALSGLGPLPQVVIPGGAIAVPLTWTLTAGSEGNAEVVLSVAGEDVNSGAPVAASASAGSLLVEPAAP